MLASRPSLIDAAIDHLDGPDDEDFAGIAGFEERIAFTEGNFRLIDSTTPSSGSRSGSQPGQTKPSGQRRLNKNATQLASSENAFWNSESERALASWRPHAADLTIHYI